MRVTREQAALNRQRILDSAIRLFGERGVDRVGVVEVMAGAGFTHGGFYNHFASKDELVNHACRASFERSVAAVRRNTADPQRTAADGEFGHCLSAAMLSEPANRDGQLAVIYAEGVASLLDVLAERFGDRTRAATALAGYVGSQLLTRAVQAADPVLADTFAPVLGGATADAGHRGGAAHPSS